MKRILIILFSAIMLLLTPTTTYADTIQINKTSESLYIGETLKLKLTGTSDYIMWKSKDSSVASVTKHGLVTAKKVGNTTITAAVGSGKNIQKFKCIINVKSRLNTDEKSIVIPSDEYYDIMFNWDSAKEGETLLSIDGDASIAYSKWLNDDRYMLRVFPEDTGYAKIGVCIGNEDGYDNVKYLDYVFVNVFVVDEPGWIPDSLLIECNGYGLIDYVIGDLDPNAYDNYGESIDYTYDEDEISVMDYKGTSIRYRYLNNFDIIYNVEDLIAAGLI